MIDVRVLALPAFTRENRRDELDPWLDHYSFEQEFSVSGVPGSVYCTNDGLAVAVTGVGKAAAATTVTALVGSSHLDLDDAYVISSGIAGTTPDVGTIGAVFVADAVVDWDLKLRWAEDARDDDPPIGLLPFRTRDYVYRPDDRLVEAARRIAEDVELVDDADVRAYRERYPHEAANRAPFVGVGVTVCGDEFWHGDALAEQVDWLVDTYGAGTYATTEAEDAGTAAALDRFGMLDRYLSVRGVSNFDRPHPGQTTDESLERVPAGIDLGVENAFRVASAVVDCIISQWDRWKAGVPSVDDPTNGRI